MRTRLWETHVKVGKLCIVCHAIGVYGLSAKFMAQIFKEEGMPEWNRTMIQRHTKGMITPAMTNRLNAKKLMVEGNYSLNQIVALTGVSKSTLQSWRRSMKCAS